MGTVDTIATLGSLKDQTLIGGLLDIQPIISPLHKQCNSSSQHLRISWTKTWLYPLGFVFHVQDLSP